MGKADIKLTPEIRDVLLQATYSIDEGSMTLPPTKIYGKVKVFLEAIGAPWNKKKKYHDWGPEAYNRLQVLLEEGGFTDKKKLYQQYYTSETVVRDILYKPLHGLCYWRHHYERDFRIMEPSAGAGAFANNIQRWLTARCEVYKREGRRTPADKLVCVEIDPDNVKALKEQGHAVLAGDFLALQPKASSLCDFIFMNPPFTNGQDMQHVTHAFRFLKPGGELFAIVSGNAGMGQSKQHQAFADLLGAYCNKCDYLESGAFADAGTQVRTKTLHFTHPDF